MKLEDTLKQIMVYETDFRNPNRPKFEISLKYDLSPQADQLDNCWPYSYPYGNKPGVYLILDKNDNVLYIGKSSKYIGGRLSSYFKYGENGECFFKHEGWTNPPKYVVTIPMEQNFSFECASLEEYLILTIDPSDNYNLKKR